MLRAKRLLAILLSVVMAAFLSFGFAYADVSSPNESTRVLSGVIGENVDLDESVTNVVLDGVTMDNGARIRMKADRVTLTLADGTSNKVAAVEGLGSLDVQGSGNLDGGSIFAMGGISFNGTGRYSLPEGGISILSGELALNSGSFDISSGGDTGYAIAAMGGNISVNGADLNLHGRISALYSGGTVVLAGGSLQATSDEDAAVMSGYKISNGITVGDSMTLADGLKPADITVSETVVTTLVNDKGEGAKSVTAQGASVAAGSVSASQGTYVPTSNDLVDGLLAYDAASGADSGLNILQVGVLAVLCIAALLAVAYFVVRRKRALKPVVSAVLAVVLSVYGFNATALEAWADDTILPISESAATDRFMDNLVVKPVDAKTTEHSADYSGSLNTGTVVDDSNTWEYFYSDQYFTQPSTKYNASLATTSLAMARSAFGVIDWDHEDYTYAYRNIETFLKNNGFKDITPNKFMSTVPTVETVGVTVGNKTITDADGKKSTLVAVAVRGGNYEAEWGSNVRIGATGEAEGFAHARDLVIEHLTQYLAANGHQFEKDLKIWIAGFSRAAATSNLTGNFLDCAVQGTGESTELMQAARSALSGYQISTDDIFCYTFETPQGAHDTSIYKAKDNSNLFCNIIPVDPVPAVAPTAFGFKHYGIVRDVSDVDFGKVQANAVKVGGKLVPYGYVQNQDGQEPFAPYIFTGAMESIDSLVSSYLSDKPIGKSLFKSYRSSFDKAKFTSRADYNQKLFNVVCAAAGGREGYANELQPFVSLVTEKYMGGTMAECATFKKAFKDGAMEHVKYHELIMLAIEVLRPGAVGGLLASGVVEGSKVGGAGGMLLGAGLDVAGTVFACGYRLGMWAMDGLCSGAVSLHKRIEGALWDGLRGAYNAGVITEEQLAQSGNCASAFATFLITYLAMDSECDFQFTLTAAAHGGVLFSPHYPSVCMSYLMAADPNYDSTHRIKVTGWNKDLAKDARATVYSVDEKGAKTAIATVEGGKLVAASGSKLPDTLKLAEIPNGYVIESAYEAGESASAKGISADIASGDSVAVEYTNHGNTQTGFANVTQHFEQAEIPMGVGDTLTLTVRNSSPEATIAKKVTPQFVYGAHDEATDSYGDIKPVRWLYMDGKAVQLNDQGLLPGMDVDRTCSFSTSDSVGEGKTPFNVYKAKRNADGSIGKDPATGKLEMTRIESQQATFEGKPAITWTESFDLNSTSPVYLVESVSASEELTVSAAGVAYDEAGGKKAPEGVSLSLQNQTTGEQISNQPLKAHPGDIINVTVSSYDKKDIFMRWSVEAPEETLQIKEGSPFSTSFTFVMPCHKVSLSALFFEQCEGALAVFEGSWAYDCSMAAKKGVGDDFNSKTPQDLGWKELYSDALGDQKTYLADGSHVLKLDGSSEDAKNGFLFVEALPRIEQPTGDPYVFDHWEVRYVGGDQVNDPVAKRLGIEYDEKGDFKSAYFPTEDTEAFFAPNNSTEPVLCIPNALIKQSIDFTPVYVDEQYEYSFLLSNGDRVTGKAKPGQSVTVTDPKADKEFSSWEASFKAPKVTKRDDGTLAKGYTTSKLAISDAAHQTLTFVMPHGQVWGKAISDIKLYKLNTVREVELSVGGTAKASDVTTVGSRYEFKAGETVVLRLKYDGSKVVTGWNKDSDVDIKNIMGPEGYEDRFAFVMPDHDVTITPILKDASRHTLEFEGEAATNKTKGVDLYGGTTYTQGPIKDVHEGNVFQIYPGYREGQHVYQWGYEVKAYGNEQKDVELQHTMQPDQSLILVMPDADIRVFPMWEENRPQ